MVTLRRDRVPQPGEREGAYRCSGGGPLLRLDNLTLATEALNDLKGAKDAAEWEPAPQSVLVRRPRAGVKLEYGLTVDPQEAASRTSCGPTDRSRPHEPPAGPPAPRSRLPRRRQRRRLARRRALWRWPPLQDRDLSEAERYAWRERRAAARRGLARG